MDQRAPQEYVLEIFADQTFVKDIVKGKPLSFDAVSVLDIRILRMSK